MIRLFNVYYPVRTVILLIGDALIVGASLLVAVVWASWPDSYLALVREYDGVKIIAFLEGGWSRDPTPLGNGPVSRVNEC